MAQVSDKNGVIYRRCTFNDQTYDQLLLPGNLKDEIFCALHDDLGHQGRARKTKLQTADVVSEEKHRTTKRLYNQ